jgi:hypothetical protein
VVIVGGTFMVKPEEREAFLASRHESMRASRAEGGCLEYAFSADPLDPSRVLLFERWADQASLDQHLVGLMSAPPSNAPSVNPTSASVVMYDVAGERTLM